MHGEDDGQALGLGSDGLGHVTRNLQSERGRGDIEGFNVLERRLNGDELGLDGYGGQFLLHAIPESVEIIRHRQAPLDLGRINRGTAKTKDRGGLGLGVGTIDGTHLNEARFIQRSSGHGLTIYELAHALLVRR